MKKTTITIDNGLNNQIQGRRETDGVLTDVERNDKRVKMIASVVNEAENSDSSSDSDMDEKCGIFIVGDYF